jgi:hypothetical protein
MNCPRCKTPLVADSRFCGSCGYAVANPMEADTASTLMENDGETMIAASWPAAQQASAQGQPLTAQSSLYEAPTVRQMSPSPQPGTFQAPPAANWSPQQQPQTSWTPAPNQLQGGSWPQQAPTQHGNWSQQQQPANWQQPMQTQGGSWPQQNQYGGMMPGTFSRTGEIPTKKRKRGGRILARLLLVLILLAAVLAGAWFLGVRPYLHNLAQNQLVQALDDAEGQILLFQNVLPGGRQLVTVDEETINVYLGSHSSSQLQHLHATITPQSFELDFDAYGFHNTIDAVPIASNGLLQVTNVQVQGVLGLIMSSDELTSALDNNFHGFGQQMHRTIGQITLKEHEMDIIIN